MIQSKLLQSAEPVGDGSMETSMSLGLMKSERYSEEDEIQPRGRRGSCTTTLTWEHWIAVIQGVTEHRDLLSQAWNRIRPAATANSGGKGPHRCPTLDLNIVIQ